MKDQKINIKYQKNKFLTASIRTKGVKFCEVSLSGGFRRIAGRGEIPRSDERSKIARLRCSHVLCNFLKSCKERQIFTLKVQIILLIGIIVLLFSPSISFAQTTPSLKVTPVIIPLQLSPGKVQTHKIEIENLSTAALPLRAQFSDFEPASEDGGYILEQNSKTSLASWISLSEKEFILAPKEKKIIQLQIQTPATIPVGGYYSLLFFEPVLPKVTNATMVQSRIGILILGDIGIYDKKEQKADILTFSLGGIIHEQPTLPLLLRVQNTNLHHVNAKPFLILKPLFGNEQEYALEEKYIFPGKVRRWHHELTAENVQAIGIYQAMIKVSTGNGEQISAKTFFIIFPVSKTLLLLIILTTTLFFYKKRKQIRTAMRILVKG